MRGTARFARVVAGFRAFLVAIQRLHRAVHVEDPWLAQQRRRAIIEVVLEPGPAGFVADLFQITAHRVLADHLAHAEQRRVNRIAP
jgi:hypothetical protein